MFKSRAQLCDLVPRLLEHSTRSFTAQDVLAFLGRKLHGKFEGEVLTDLRVQELKGRLRGHRVKHRMKQNWIKMYDKAGLVLRIETVINAPEEFRVRRRVRRRGCRKTEWVPLRKGVVYLFRYREICLQSNSRYLAALAQVDNPTPALRDLDTITVPKTPANGRSVKAFNPVARLDSQLFGALMSGEHALTASPIGISATSSGGRSFASATSPRPKARKSAGCSTGSTSMDSWRRFLARAAGG